MPEQGGEDPVAAAGGELSRSIQELARRELEEVARESLGLGAAVEAPESQPEPAGPASAASGDPRTIAAVLRSAPEGIVLFDESAEIVDWSPAAQRILGHPRDMAVGRNLLELLFPERTRAAMRGVIADHAGDWGEASNRSIEVSLLDRDGEEVPVELTLSWASGSSLFVAHLVDGRERSDRERQFAAESRRRTQLLQLGQLALGASSLEALIGRTLEAAADECGFEVCDAWEVDPASDELVLLERRLHGRPELGAERRTPPPGSALASALHSPSTSVVTGDHLLPDPWQPTAAAGEPTGSGAVALIIGADGVLGVLSGSAAPGHTFSGAETSYLESLAQILASAIERDRFTSSLSEAEARLRSIIERLPSITYRAGLGETGHWHFISPQIEEILGFSPEDCLADEFWWERQVHPDDLRRVLDEEERCAREQAALDVEYRMLDRQGRLIWVRDRASIGREVDGESVVEGIITDVTTQKAAEDRLRYLADHDHLTSLLNRRGFEQAVDERLRTYGERAAGALAVIDLDHLKLINDSLGHAAGDRLLRETADGIAAELERGDVFGRLSGDEFGLFIPGIDEDGAKRVLGRILDLLRGGSTGLALTASVGATVIETGRETSAAKLLVAADMALYRAKERGRDRIAFSDAGDDERLQWVATVREAVEAERLLLYAQPIVDIASGERQADELLVRMVGPDGEPVSAGRFIPTAERFGLIRQVDRWVVSRAVDLALAGRPVSVNVSAASIADAELTTMVERKLDAGGGVEPGMLTVEITETLATPQFETLIAFAERIEGLGIELSLDDVGTGFGSLTYLQSVRFSKLKIDMQFVRGILKSETDRKIVRSLVTIARELGQGTVAEGVESQAVLDELTKLGVESAQGFFLGRPEEIALAPPVGS